MESSVQLQATLEVLNRKAKDQLMLLGSLKRKKDDLYEVMVSEREDVERLESENFKTSLFKLLRIHDGQLTKEQEEYLRAKLAYENHCFEVEEASRQLRVLEEKAAEAKKALDTYQSELGEKAKALLKLAPESPKRVVFEKFTLKERTFKQECVEIEEAIEACKRAIVSKTKAKDLLDDAKDLAFWDTWGGGGLLTDMAKYEKLEAVQVEFKRLKIELEHLLRELSDVGEMPSLEVLHIGEGTKAMDIWFDNIFTDHRVKEQISEQITSLVVLEGQLSRVADHLEHRYQAALSGLRASTEAVENLIME